MTTKGKVLALISSGRKRMKDGKIYTGAGYYLNRSDGSSSTSLMKEGYEITFANPTGNTPGGYPFRGRRLFSAGTRPSCRTTCYS